MLYQKRNSSSIIITIGGFLSFLIFGFIDNIKGPVLPSLLKDMHLEYSEGGIVLMASYFGFMGSTLVIGFLSEVIGEKKLLLLAGVILFFAVSAIVTFHSFALLIVAMILLGIGTGCIEIGANGIIVKVHRLDTGRYMNLLGFFHGLGAMIAPIMAGKLLDAGYYWRDLYQFSIFVVIPLPIYFLFVRFNKGSPTQLGSVKKIIAVIDFRTLYHALVLCCYVAAEVGVAVWMVEYLQQKKTLSVMLSSSFLSFYWANITIGRLLGSIIVDKIGYQKVSVIAVLAATLFLSGAIFLPPTFAILLPITGVFFSIIFPTVTAAAAFGRSSNLGAIFGVLFFFAGLGGMLGSWSVGKMSDLMGLTAGYSVNIVFCLGTLFFLMLLGISDRAAK